MKKSLAFLIALCMVFSLAACGGTTEAAAGTEPAAAETAAAETAGTADGEMGLVGFCTTSMTESIYVLEEAALKEIFAGKAEVQTQSCDQDSAKQISQIQTFALMGADLIVINPTDIDAISDAIIEAHNAGCKIYINGATSDNLSPEYYECCSMSDEYLNGAYVAMIAKNWIENHLDQLGDADGDWELAFLESSLGEETVKRSKGEQSLVDPYLKDWEGNYVDASGNVVDESAKVANPAYSEIAAAHFSGNIVEQDQSNAAQNVANVLTTNPNTRVFIAYNSLASSQGGQYIVDNYPDELDQFAFFSSGVMGNEADYIVGSVSGTDGVPSVFRGAVQFGVSAAGGEVADSVANTAYGILYGAEGVDYSKINPEGIAAWWAVDETWGGGTATVAHFNILSGATVQAFDPIAALTDANTVQYWNSKDGFLEAAAETAAPDAAAAPQVAGETFTYSENNGFMDITWTLSLLVDGTYTLTETNQMFPDGKTYTGSAFTRTGTDVVCAAMVGGGPEVFTWADPAGFHVTLNVSDSTFAPIMPA